MILNNVPIIKKVNLFDGAFKNKKGHKILVPVKYSLNKNIKLLNF